MKALLLGLGMISSMLITGCATGTFANGSRPETTNEDIAALFDRWNRSLQTGDPEKVVANYAEESILLPTASNKPRLTPEEKADYFEHFLQDRPSGEIILRRIDIDGNMAVDSGLYTFRFSKTEAEIKARYSFTYRWDGNQWLIISHHSSAMPEN